MSVGVIMFRSTPLHEGRRRLASARRYQDGVSIHAPARGATRRNSSNGTRSNGFDPRPCTRGPFATRPSRPLPKRFRSTPLHEGRPLPVYHFIRTGKTGVLARTQLTRGARFDDRALGRIRKLSISVGYGRRDPPRRLLHACGSRASERSPGLRLPASFSPPPIR